MEDAVIGNDGNEAAFLSYIRDKDPKLGLKAAKVFQVWPTTSLVDVQCIA